MKKPLFFALSLALSLASVAPAALADFGEKPLTLKQPTFYQQNDGLKASVTVCNNNQENLRFTLQAENLQIAQVYRRNLMVELGGCQSYELFLPTRFAEMSKEGDQIRVSLRRTEGLKTASPYRRPDAEMTTIVAKKTQNTTEEVNSCQNVKGGDALYSICRGLFIEHSSGVRLKVLQIDPSNFQVMSEGLRWGSSQTLRLFPGKTKTVRPAKGGILYLTNEGGKLSVRFVR